MVNHVFSEETFEADVMSYVREYEKTSKSAVALTKSLLHQIDGMTFSFVGDGVDVNVIAGMTEDCQQEAGFLKKD